MADYRARFLRVRALLPDAVRSMLPAACWAGVLVACTVAWSFRLVSFLHAKELVLLIGLGGIALCMPRALLPSREGLRFFMSLWLAWGYGLFTGLFTSEVLTYHVEESLRFFLLLFVAVCCYPIVAHPRGRRWVCGGLVAGGGIIALLALLQYAGWAAALFPVFPGYDQRAYSVFGNQNLLGGFLAPCLVLTAARLFRVRRAPAWCLTGAYGLFFLLAAGLVVSQTRTAWLATVAGGLCAVPWRSLILSCRSRARMMRRMPPIVLISALVILAGWPLLMARSTQSFSEGDVGGRARLWFWAGAVRMIRDHPFIGVGTGNYRYWSPCYQGEALWAPGGHRLYHNELHTVHAHSEPLERLAENGVTGSLFLVWFLLRIPRRRAGLWAGLLSLLVFSLFNTVSHSAPHVLMILLLAAMIHARHPAYARIAARRGISPALHSAWVRAGILLVIAANLWTIHIPSYLLCAAEQAHVRGENPRELYQRVLKYPWFVPQAHEDYAIALMDEERFEEAREQLEWAAKGLDTGRLHLLRAVCVAAGCHGDRKACADTVIVHARACLYRWPSNEWAWSLLQEHLPPEEAMLEKRRRERWMPAVPTP